MLTKLEVSDHSLTPEELFAFTLQKYFVSLFNPIIFIEVEDEVSSKVNELNKESDEICNLIA